MLKTNNSIRTLIISVIIVSLLIVISSCSTKQTISNLEIVYEGNHNGFISQQWYAKDINELESFSDLIVRAEVLLGSESIDVIHEQANIRVYSYMKTKLKIKEVIKGQVDSKTILLAESCYIKDNKIISKMDYKPTTTTNEYIFFLRKYHESHNELSGFYHPIDFSHSKYLVLDNYNEDSINDMSIEELDISNINVDEYKQWYKDAMKVYKKLKVKNNISEVEAESDLIIRATVLPNKQNIEIFHDVLPMKLFGDTSTRLQINEVLKGQPDSDVITLLENYHTDDETKEVIVQGDYKHLKENKEYIFFLSKNDGDSEHFIDTYTLADLVKGKYVYDENYDKYKVGKMTAEELDISDKTKLKEYKEFYKDAMDLYKELKEKKEK